MQVAELKFAVPEYIFLVMFLFRYAEESECKMPYSYSLHKANSPWICSGSHQAPWNLRLCIQCQLLTLIPQPCFSQGFIYVLFPFKQMRISSW